MMPKRAASPWIDATMEFGAPAGTWPGDAPFKVEWTGRLQDRKWGVNLSRVSSSPHNGTHADAPYHVDEKGAKSEGLPLGVFMGPCLVVDVSQENGDVLGAGLAAEILRAKPERVLFKTRKGPPPAAFPRRFIGLDPELTERLVTGGVRLLGTDAPSVDRADIHGLKSHAILFAAGSFNLENLDLSRVEAGPHELHAPPLKVTGLCAAPVRALLRAL